MAPDLNSVPPSAHPEPTNSTSNSTSNLPTPGSQQNSRAVSRRASQIYPMGPPPLPLASPGGTQHTQAFPPLSPNLSGHVPSADSAGTPMRHPRPMTAAELHLELEKEQEAVVNRLTRELSALRAHSASVASTTSSVASGVLVDTADPSVPQSVSMAGPTHPTSSRRHRSSSSVSRSGATGMPPGVHPHRQSISSQPATSEMRRSSSIMSTPRYEEVAHQRAELEEAKKENEALKQRIRELERMLKGNESDGQRGRSGAPSTSSVAVPE
jgi:hypothetical protein